MSIDEKIRAINSEPLDENLPESVKVAIRDFEIWEIPPSDIKTATVQEIERALHRQARSIRYLTKDGIH